MKLSELQEVVNTAVKPLTERIEEVAKSVEEISKSDVALTAEATSIEMLTAENVAGIIAEAVKPLSERIEEISKASKGTKAIIEETATEEVAKSEADLFNNLFEK